jgi:hypothetical protein
MRQHDLCNMTKHRRGQPRNLGIADATFCAVSTRNITYIHLFYGICALPLRQSSFVYLGHFRHLPQDDWINIILTSEEDPGSTGTVHLGKMTVEPFGLEVPIAAFTQLKKTHSTANTISTSTCSQRASTASHIASVYLSTRKPSHHCIVWHRKCQLRRKVSVQPFLDHPVSFLHHTSIVLQKILAHNSKDDRQGRRLTRRYLPRNLCVNGDGKALV